MNRPCSRSRGFTLVELLVVIAIIGVLVSLLLPAVQSAREAGRRTQCVNNMKQIGLALQNYHDTHQRFPPSGILYGDNVKPRTLPHVLPYHHTWLIMILPFIEQGPLYDEVDKNWPVMYRPNPTTGTMEVQPIVGTLVKNLLCPSDLDVDLAQTGDMAYTNYAGSEGYSWWTQTLLDNTTHPTFEASPQDFSGVFTILMSNNGKSITDGTSNVIACAEVTTTGFKWGELHSSGTGVARLNASSERVFRAAFVWTGYGGECCQTGRYRDPAGTALRATKDWWPTPGGAPMAFSPTYLSQYGPNAEWPGAGSRHPGIVNVVLADGAVRSIQQNVEWVLWAKLNSIGDTYPVGAF